MASIDGARSVKSSAEEGFQFECGPCENDGVTIEAIYFCPECKDYLCESCETSHKRFRSTRNHRVLEVSVMPEKVDDAQIIDPSSTLCLCLRNEVEIYCEFHDAVFCSDCKNIKHRLCQTVLIDEMVRELDQTFDDTILQDADEVKATLTSLQITRTEDQEQLSAETEKCKNDILSFRTELNQTLDKLEETALNALYESSDLHKNVIDQHLDVCNSALTTLSLDYTNHVNSKNTQNRRHKFLTSYRLKQTLKGVNTALNDMHGEAHKPRLSFDRHATLSAVLDTDLFGVLHHNLACRRKCFNADMKVHWSRKLNVKMQSDKRLTWISGSVFMPDGDLVLCDRNNDCLKVFDKTFASAEKIKLSGKPRDCCHFNEKTLLVTLPEEKQIQCFNTVPTIQLKKSVDLDKQCEGIASLNAQEIFVTCYSPLDKEIRILDQNCNLKKTIELNEMGTDPFKYPCYVATYSTGMVYVNEVSADFISQTRAFSKDGLCKYTYSDSNAKGSLGMLVDGEGRLLICLWKSNKVIVLNEDGVTAKDFFEPNVDITEPYSISYRENDATLVVTFRDNNEILICKMK